MVEKSAALRHTFHVALRIIFLIEYFISYTLTPGFPTSHNGLSKKRQKCVFVHLTPNRDTEINALWKGSFQILKIQNKRKGLKREKIEYLAIL